MSEEGVAEYLCSDVGLQELGRRETAVQCWLLAQCVPVRWLSASGAEDEAVCTGWGKNNVVKI